jgi:DNA-binding LacI/PurR family transcriptional regulator
VADEAAYRRIAKDLHGQIASGRHPAGGSLASLRRLAQQYGVGQNTIRLAVDRLKEEGLVRTGPGRRLLAVPPESFLGRVVLLAMALSRSRQAWPRYMRSTVSEMVTAASNAGRPLLIVRDPRLSGSLPREALDLPASGVLLYGFFKDEVLRRYEQLAVPVVLVDDDAGGLKMHSVGFDNVGAGREAAGRLIALGHRRIAFLRIIGLARGGVDRVQLERQKGFQAAMKEAGLDGGSDAVINVFESPGSGGSPYDRLFGSTAPFTAAVASSESHANRVVQFARETGRSVPADFSVIACAAPTESDTPQVAACRFDFAAIGARAVELLDGPRLPPKNLLLPWQWCPGRTMGPAPAAGV